jgi:hypothetical protein
MFEGLVMTYVGIFYSHLVFFIAIWYILWPFGIIYGNWVYFHNFGMLCPGISGNPCPQSKRNPIFIWIVSWIKSGKHWIITMWTKTTFFANTEKTLKNNCNKICNKIVTKPLNTIVTKGYLRNHSIFCRTFCYFFATFNGGRENVRHLGDCWWINHGLLKNETNSPFFHRKGCVLIE